MVIARGPILEIGGGLAIDTRFVDRVELASRFTDPGGLRLLVTLESVEVALEIDGTIEQAEDTIVAIAPYTRAAPLTNDIDYATAEDLFESILEGEYEPPPLVLVKGEPVVVADGLVSVGMIGWVVEDVLEAARKGNALELADGKTAPAAVFTLAIAAAEPPDLGRLSDRLREYRERVRTRNPS